MSSFLKVSQLQTDPKNSIVREYLRMSMGMFGPRPSDSDMRHPHQIILNHGVMAPIIQRPKGIGRGVPHECFSNSLHFVARNPKYTYVEGFAMGVLPMHHAWVMTPDGEFMDLTWEKPGTEYVGGPFPERLCVSSRH
jgi:hypothetical protein